MPTSKITTNHDEIKKWAEEREAKPSVVKSTDDNADDIIRFNFPAILVAIA